MASGRAVTAPAQDGMAAEPLVDLRARRVRALRGEAPLPSAAPRQRAAWPAVRAQLRREPPRAPGEARGRRPAATVPASARRR